MSSALTSTTTPACLHSSYILIRSAFILAILSASRSARTFAIRLSLRSRVGLRRPREEDERNSSLLLHAAISWMTDGKVGSGVIEQRPAVSSAASGPPGARLLYLSTARELRVPRAA